MPDTKKKKPEQDSELSMFDRAAKNIFSFLDSGYKDREILSSKDQKIRSILNRELEISKGVSQGSIIDFVASLKDSKKTNPLKPGQDNSPDTNELFTKNINDIFGYFQEMYRNRFIEMSDLKFIAKFIPALGKAVRITLNSICSSDTISESISRQIYLPPSVSERDKSAIINEIERIEKNKDMKLLKRLKNIAYKKSLITGTHYVYAVSYNKIFEEYDKIKKRNERDSIKSGRMASQGQQHDHLLRNKTGVSESYTKGSIDFGPVMESVSGMLNDTKLPNGKLMSQKRKDAELKHFYDNIPEVVCMESTIMDDALESAETLFRSRDAMEAFRSKNKASDMNFNLTTYKGDMSKVDTKRPMEIGIPDGTKDINDKNIKPSKFNIPGTYIKYIDAKNIIPLRVFDQVIGYYLINPKVKKNGSSVGKTDGITSIGNTLFSAVNIGEEKKNDVVRRITDTISEGIMNSFDLKFVTKNAEYKKMIADCVIANGLTDKDYNIQFIPESDIIPFTIQETEDGFGESVLTDSLFPAKALLTMISCRMLNYINKTGNKTIVHSHRGQVSVTDNNHIQRIIRDLQDEDITFNDLLSPNLVFNKFNRDGKMVIPTSKNGDHLLEFETQEGQNIDMNPEYEETLEKMAVMGTNVPSVIMEYVNQVDFAKQIVSAQIEFAGWISTLQSDLEEPTTRLYKKLCENSNLSNDQKTICAQNLEIKLPRPNVITNTNNSEYIPNAVTNAESIADVKLGRESISDTEKNPNGVKIKEKLMYKLVRQNSPYVDWDEVDKMTREAMIEAEEEVIMKPSTTGGDSGGEDMGY